MINLVNKANGVNLRKDPTINSTCLGSLSKNENLEFIEFDTSKQWVKVKRTYNSVGWANYKYFISDGFISDFPADPLWLRIAYGEYGVAEFLEKGKSNPDVERYLNSCNVEKNVKDNTAWCSAFVNWCIEKAGYEGTDSTWAQSWTNWGQKVDEPFRGCIAVFKRYYSEKGKVKEGGHVGFFVSKDNGSKISILGGNQNNQVIIKSFSVDNLSNPPKAGEYKLIGFRKPFS